MLSLKVRTMCHVENLFFRNSFFRHIKKALKGNLVHTSFDFIICYDLDNVNIAIISIQ